MRAHAAQVLCTVGCGSRGSQLHVRLGCPSAAELQLTVCCCGHLSLPLAHCRAVCCSSTTARSATASTGSGSAAVTRTRTGTHQGARLAPTSAAGQATRHRQQAWRQQQQRRPSSAPAAAAASTATSSRQPRAPAPWMEASTSRTEGWEPPPPCASGVCVCAGALFVSRHVPGAGCVAVYGAGCGCVRGVYAVRGSTGLCV